MIQPKESPNEYPFVKLLLSIDPILIKVYEKLKKDPPTITDLFKDIKFDLSSKRVEELNRLITKEAHKISLDLPKFFANDLKEYLEEENKEAIFLFDNYTLLWEDKTNRFPCSPDLWIREMVSILSHNSIFILFSHKELEWNICEDRWNFAYKNIQLRNFSTIKSGYYLTSKGVTSPILIDAIFKITKGSPLFLNMAANYYQDSEVDLLPKSKEDIINNYLSILSEDIIEILPLLAHSRFFTYDLISKMKKKFLFEFDPKDISKFEALNFIKKDESNRYYIDNIVKEYLKNKTPTPLKKELKAFFFAYYESLLQNFPIEPSIESNFKIDEIVDEAWYHLRLLNQDPLLLCEWLDYYIERFYHIAPWSSFVDKYEAIIEPLKNYNNVVAIEKLAIVYNNLAGLYEAMGEYKIAKSFYQKMIKIYKEELTLPLDKAS